MLMPVKVYFCYTHEDEPLLKQIMAHLKPLQRQGLITTWHDRDIKAGVRWDQQISQQLDSAQIILLLVSSAFMASEYCYSVEMKRAMERYYLQEACVIPIILSPCDWRVASFNMLQALPKNAKPISEWDDREAAFNNIVDNIRKVVNEISNLGGQTML